MKHLLLITASLALLAGCGKQESPAPAAAPKPSPTMPSLQPTAEVKPAGTATPSQIEASKVPILNTKVDLAVLTKALVDYCKKTQANPISLDEVVQAGFLPGLPALPPGKKFDIDRDTYKVIIVEATAAELKPPPTMPSLQPAGAKSPLPVNPSQPQPSKVPILQTKVDLDALTKALVAYCRKTQANPISLDEVVQAGFLPGLPELPPGKKFDIDRDTYKVIIVDAPIPSPSSTPAPATAP